MDNRLIFLYCATRVISVVGTEKDKHASYMLVQGSRELGEAKSPQVLIESRCGGIARFLKMLSPYFPENLRREFVVHSYRKPTQVG
jgi:hypothetical protein